MSRPIWVRRRRTRCSSLASPLLRRLGARRILFTIPSYDQAMVEWLRDRLENGNFSPLIDRVYALDEIVDAFEYVETGQKTGNVVIRVSQAVGAQAPG